MMPTQLAAPACTEDPAARTRPRVAAHPQVAMLAMGLAVLAARLLEHPYAGLILPSAYGSAEYFHYTEDFLTPRLPAEALVLAAIAAALARSYLWAALAVLTALLVHPIMGLAGGVWYLLERANYWSYYQVVGAEPVTIDSNKTSGRMYLYRCADFGKAP